MSDTAAAWFEGIAQSYDSLIRRAVPRYDEMLDRLVRYLPAGATAVAELGCGSGNLTLRLAKRWPNAALTIVDAVQDMATITASRLGVTSGKAAAQRTVLVQRFEDLSLGSQSMDVVTSSLSLHHVRDQAALYQMIRRALRPGGHFVFADQFLGNPAAVHDVNWNGWLAHCREANRCSPEEIQSMVEHATTHDHYVPVVDHFRLLETAGFGSLDCVWRDGMWGIITAVAS